jgi:hypothetical protein
MELCLTAHCHWDQNVQDIKVVSNLIFRIYKKKPATRIWKHAPSNVLFLQTTSVNKRVERKLRYWCAWANRRNSWNKGYSVLEIQVFLLCYVLPTGKQIPEFLRIVLPSYSQSSSSWWLSLGCSVLNMKALPSLQAPAAIHQSTQRNITESLILQRHYLRTIHDTKHIFKNRLISTVAGGNVNKLVILKYVQHK